MKKILFAICGVGLTWMAGAVDLTGTASVRITSDTAATAKTMAINDARRQILVDKLKSYSMSDQLIPAIRGAKNVELTDLISETSIDGEKISDTTYSANITMTVDRDAARKWLNDNNVQNWLGDGGAVDVFTMQITLNNPITDWAHINSIARRERVDLATKNINGNKVTVELSKSARTGFTIALHGAGWHTSATDDAVRVWK